MSEKKDVKKGGSHAKTYADSSQKKTTAKKPSQESLKSNRKNLMLEFDKIQR